MKMLNVYYCKINQERRPEEHRNEINEMPKLPGHCLSAMAMPMA